MDNTLQEFLKEFSSEIQKPFLPKCFYHPDADCIDFIGTPEAHFAKRLNEIITIYIGLETQEIVGFNIKTKGIFSMLKKILLDNYSIVS